MAGMIQILTYMMGVYLVIKGVEIFQIGLASNRENRSTPITVGIIALGVCVLAALYFVNMQDQQAQSLSASMQNVPRY